MVSNIIDSKCYGTVYLLLSPLEMTINWTIAFQKTVNTRMIYGMLFNCTVCCMEKPIGMKNLNRMQTATFWGISLIHMP